jgi:hypothetical protein
MCGAQIAIVAVTPENGGLMLYEKPTWSCPTTNRPMSQTEYEIRVGLRNPDGSLKRPKKK